MTTFQYLSDPFVNSSNIKVGDHFTHTNWKKMYCTVTYISEDKSLICYKYSDKPGEHSEYSMPFDRELYRKYVPPVERKVWTNFFMTNTGIWTPSFDSIERAKSNYQINNNNKSGNVGYLNTHYSIWIDNKLYSGSWIDFRKEK